MSIQSAIAALAVHTAGEMIEELAKERERVTILRQAMQELRSQPTFGHQSEIIDAALAATGDQS